MFWKISDLLGIYLFIILSLKVELDKIYKPKNKKLKLRTITYKKECQFKSTTNTK